MQCNARTSITRPSRCQAPSGTGRSVILSLPGTTNTVLRRDVVRGATRAAQKQLAQGPAPGSAVCQDPPLQRTSANFSTRDVYPRELEPKWHLNTILAGSQE